MSSGRLFLDRGARQHCPSPLHRQPDHKTLDGFQERIYYRMVTASFPLCLTKGVHPIISVHRRESAASMLLERIFYLLATNKRGTIMDLPIDSLTESVIGAAFEVSNTLGAGFLEKVYERALLRELKLQRIESRAQAGFPVIYKEQNVGDYFADILVEGRFVLELKCVDRLTNDHMAQCINYLRVSKMTLCLLINFQKPVVEWRRIVLNHPGGSA